MVSELLCSAIVTVAIKPPDVFLNLDTLLTVTRIEILDMEVIPQANWLHFEGICESYKQVEDYCNSMRLL